MKNTTIIRRIDDLGRFVLPIDVRKKLNIMPGDTLEMTVYNDGIQIKKSTSLQNLIWLAKIIIKNLFEIYKMETALEDENNILLTTKKTKKEEYKRPIVFDNHKVGNFIVYDYHEEDKNIVDFVVLFFNKYLEEQR